MMAGNLPDIYFQIEVSIAPNFTEEAESVHQIDRSRRNRPKYGCLSLTFGHYLDPNF